MNPPDFKKAGRITLEPPAPYPAARTYIRQYLGFIAPLVVLVPCLIHGVYRANFYRGCMDDFGYFMAAAVGFVLGGLINLVFLIYVFSDRRRYFEMGGGRDRGIAKVGVIISVMLVPAQIGILLFQFK